MHEGSANPVVISDALNNMAVEMERQPKYFDPELPETFRFLAEAASDPQGATKTVVYGAVRSVENVVSFLGQRALGIGINAAGAVEQHISKAIAAFFGYRPIWCRSQHFWSVAGGMGLVETVARRLEEGRRRVGP
jgi:hypothetical protein